jgi:hypothetical protein
MPGLKQQILSAPSAEVINTLLAEGKTYEFAAASTQRSWARAAKVRTAQLKGEKAPEPVAPTYAEPVAPKKKRGNKKKLNPVVTTE